MAYWIKVGNKGLGARLVPSGTQGFTLDELRAFVRTVETDEGWIEIVRYGPLLNPAFNRIMVVNETGAIALSTRGPLPINVTASVIAGQEIHGDVLVCSPKEAGEEHDA